MRQHFESPLSLVELTQVLDELSVGCDQEFDSVYEELEREFAELRFIGNN